MPARLTLTPDAYQTFQRYRATHEPRLLPTGDLGDIADWGSKQPGAVLRIAGLLHVAWNERPEDQNITTDTVRRAIGIAEYFAAHAKVMYRLMSGQGGHSAAHQVLEVIQRLTRESGVVTRSDLRRSIRGRSGFTQESDLAKPLALLEEYGRIRVIKQETGGRPSYQIILNPQKLIPEIPETPTSGPKSTITGISGTDFQESQKNEPIPIRDEPLAATGTNGYYEEEI